ncbi:hypothetical protein [Pseudonocardia acaciae]|uniref:hypothetical protein n=1 Tax=Pseudonocardia acaciae TaxID=551276 RepID=UPI0006861CD9|nr:hypothetical protein [Pseudonocardia acaciae]
MSIPEQLFFALAVQALSAVTDRIDDNQWDLPADTGMSRGTVRELVVAHARDAQWVGHVLAGRTIEDGNKIFPDQPLGDDLKSGWRDIADRAVADAQALDDPDKIVHLSFSGGEYGEFTARDYLQQGIAYHGLQAWDLARVLKVDDTLPADLVAGMTEVLAPVADQWRELGVFGPAVSVPDDASDQDKLLALTGRQP